MGPAASIDRVRDQIRLWANDLIDLSKRNTSLYYRPLKRGTVEIASPLADALFKHVSNGGRAPVDFFSPFPKDDGEDWVLEECLLHAPPGSIVTTKTKAADLDASLKALSRQTDMDLVDRGLHSLYLCFGMLHWEEVAGGDEVRSPLLFLPISLERGSPRDPWKLVRAEADIVMNASLQVALREQFDIELPDAESLGDGGDGLGVVFESVRQAIARTGWRVESTVVLKRATFHKEAMYRDLMDNIEQIADDDLISLLADPESGDVSEPELSSEEAMDLVAPPEEARLILNADASQRRAVHAASQGTSFVMDGPPGSGKSQTIANMIAELIAAGKTVLFVSEKAAALDVVHSRLSSLGLEDFLFALHSHKVSRKQVSAELGRSLNHWPVPKPRLSNVEREQALRARERLSGYAAAVNEVRAPLGRSAHWVLGRLSKAAHLPNAPHPSRTDALLSARELAQLQSEFTRLARVWAPIEEADDFLWRDFADVTYSDNLRNELSRDLEDLLKAIDECEETADALAFEAGLPPVSRLEDAGRYAAVVAHCRVQPPTEAGWWTSSNLTEACVRAEKLRQLSIDHHRDVSRLNESFGTRWREVDPVDAQRYSGASTALKNLRPSVSLEGPFDSSLCLAKIQAAQEIETLPSDVLPQLERLTTGLGLPNRSRTLQEIIDIARVAQHADALVRPESLWGDPVVLQEAERALITLTPLVSEYKARHAQVRQLFTDAVFALDLQGLTQRFGTYGPPFRKMSASYRADKRLLASVSVTGKCSKPLVAALPEALKLQKLRAQVDREELQSRELLGAFYRPRDLQSDGAALAMNTLKLAIQTLGREYDGRAVSAQLAGNAPKDPELAGCARDLLTTLEGKLDGVGRVLDETAELRDLSVEAAAKWATELRARLAEVVAVASRANTLRASPATHENLQTELLLIDANSRRESHISECLTSDREILGSSYKGFETSWADLKAGLMWTQQLQTLFGSSLPNRAGERMRGSRQIPDADPLAESHSLLRKRISSFSERFSIERSGEICAELESSFDSATAFVTGALDDVDRVGIWLEFLDCTKMLRETGFAAAVDFCCESRIDRDLLPQVLEKATLAAWLDDVVRKDDRLKGSSSSELNQLVEEFRVLDEKLVMDASELVAQACVELRPRSKVGAAGYIEKEAQKKARHMPVRLLLDKASDVVQRLKPCFMMSPLSVSQFLPSSFRFDVTIFDEASQVRPADAINCFYRADQVVIAGDENQLPPTSFFEAGSLVGDGEYEEGQFDEFESILGQCKGTVGLPALPLRWHYRSQHESLITFSNYRFYEGRLITFPGAEAEAEDLGVKFFQVDGQYRRGGPRDNPPEALAVAHRVLHHMDRHPGLSIGVVAFSQAQADAIMDALDTLRMTRPDLDELFGGDRLDGFFVKSLENVQGDERDIMVFSIGYGPDENGKFTLNFGPVNREGGWRRLNVAITRARRRVEVVASFSSSQMDTRGSSNRGVVELQRYLDYAERGVAALSLDVSSEGGDTESPMEESVLGVLTDWGYDVVPQVGSAGYRIDLGIRDPFSPGRYLLGVECDGVAYHSSKVARDRDRLRQQVLEGLGWRLHRIWGTSWYRDRKREEARLREAIEKAKQEPVFRSDQVAYDPVVRSTERVDLDSQPDWVLPYEVADCGSLPRNRLPHEPVARPALRRAVERVLTVEAPIHVDLLASRICQAWGRAATAKVREAIQSTLEQLHHENRCQSRGEVLWLTDDFDIRVPSKDPATKRDVRHVPPEELQEAIYKLLCDARLATDDDLLLNVRKLFGWERTGSKIHAALDAAISTLERDGWVQRDSSDFLRPVEAARES